MATAADEATATAENLGGRNDEGEADGGSSRGSRFDDGCFGVGVRDLRALVEASPGEGRLAELTRLGGLQSLAGRVTNKSTTFSAKLCIPRRRRVLLYLNIPNHVVHL